MVLIISRERRIRIFRGTGIMARYRIAWLPGDGIGVEVLEAARIVLDKIKLDAVYIPGDIGWEFWCRKATPCRRGRWNS